MDKAGIPSGNLGSLSAKEMGQSDFCAQKLTKPENMQPSKLVYLVPADS